MAQDLVTTDSTGRPIEDPRLATTVVICLRGSKANQLGTPVTRVLMKSGHPFICPVLGAILLLQSRRGLPRSIPAAVYADINRSPACVDAARVNHIIKRAAIAVGADPARYGSHSLRSGAATHLYRAEVDSLTVQLHSQWASDAYKLYISICAEMVASLSAKMACGPRRDTTLQRGA
ncbi:hypothetical protein PybrP1_004521 [[Pythium] brassicae (nom. inval.)]|nr:hypothetical protein PybrP1_004521 [[Pythium] brassicae (nom. inval.)]